MLVFSHTNDFYIRSVTTFKIFNEKYFFPQIQKLSNPKSLRTKLNIYGYLFKN